MRALIEMYEILIPLNQAWFPHAVLEQNGVVSKALINYFHTRLDDKACRRDLHNVVRRISDAAKKHKGVDDHDVCEKT